MFAHSGENSVLQYLIERGCDINRCDMYSVSPLQVAVMMSNPTGVKLLMQGMNFVRGSMLGLQLLLRTQDFILSSARRNISSWSCE